MSNHPTIVFSNVKLSFKVKSLIRREHYSKSLIIYISISIQKNYKTKMLILRLLFITINIFWLIEASKYLRYKEIDVKLVSEDDETFESKLREVLKKSEELLLQDVLVEGALNAGGSISGYVNGVAQLILLTKNLISSDNDVMNALVKEIPLAIERANVRQDIVNMEAKMETILFNINYLNRTIDIENADQRSIVHDIHNGLFDMVNIFNHRHAGFRYHPLSYSFH